MNENDQVRFFIHQYFGVDYEMVYNTIQNDLPELKFKVKSLLE